MIREVGDMLLTSYKKTANI